MTNTVPSTDFEVGDLVRVKLSEVNGVTYPKALGGGPIPTGELLKAWDLDPDVSQVYAVSKVTVKVWRKTGEVYQLLEFEGRPKSAGGGHSAHRYERVGRTAR